ncbi:MAG: hypothetical protein M3135_03840 [Actinomycetota bacterium]|nr:hypothetical protein [Actinomycetota bacterium]
MIAHAGGIDEIVLAVGVVLLFLLFRSSRAEQHRGEPEEGPCLYCGHPLGPGVERCPECGFRARRGTITSSASDAER